MPDIKTDSEGRKTLKIDRALAVQFAREQGLLIPSDGTLDLMVNFAGWVLTALGGEQVDETRSN